jgi:hypothetical protein
VTEKQPSEAEIADASVVKICVHHRKTANIAGLSWLGNDNLLVPSTKWWGNCAPLSDKDLYIVAVIPRMHVQGRHMKVTMTRKDAAPGREHLHGMQVRAADDLRREYDRGDVLPVHDGHPKGALAAPDLWGGFAHGGSSCLGQ